MAPVDFLYAIFAILIGGLTGVGSLIMGPTSSDYRNAKVCFWLASFLAFGMLVMWDMTVPDSTSLWVRILLVGALGAAFTVGTAETMRLVTNRETAAAAPSIPAITTTRQAYSAEVTINSLPPPLGGKNTINVDNVFTLRLSVPYSVNEVTFTINATGVQLPDKNTPQMQVSGAFVTTGPVRTILFNRTDKRTHVLREGGRAFSVNLTNVRILDTPNVANPLEWQFGIFEQ